MTSKTKILAPILILVIGQAFAADYAPPAASQGDWEPGVKTGVVGGFSQYLAGGGSDRAVSGNVIDVTDAPYNADPTGVVDCRDAVVDAYDDAVSGDVVYFPAGTFRFDTGFIYMGYKDNITIRGAGTDQTTLHCSTTSAIFVFNSPGSTSQSGLKTVTGGKTKGSSTLTVADSTGYAVGQIGAVLYENEVDDTRIEAGGIIVWHSGGGVESRKMLYECTGTTATTISIDPPLAADATNLQLRIGRYPFNVRSDGIGFEDFSVTFDNAEHPTQFINMTAAVGCWAYNLNFVDFSRSAGVANGSCIKAGGVKNCEIRKCSFNALPGSGSDGAIEISSFTNGLIEDNIITGSFGVCIYDSGNSNYSMYSYNYSPDNMSYSHNAHPSLNLVEGNVMPGFQSDGYHGSSSNNTIYRNYFDTWIILNRFKRQYSIVGNVIGLDGTRGGIISWGNPNIGNGSANGFAGPTGSSDQVGETDYSQPGYGIDEYVIQSGDISAGDFWDDWEITGTLTTRTSDTEGVFSVSGGSWAVGTITTAGNRLYPTIHWDSKASNMQSGQVTNVSGSDVTIVWPAGSLPAVSTSVQMYMGAAGWQERDLDVKATSEDKNNYYALASGTGAVTNSVSPDTLPDSLAYSAQPSWWNEDGYGLTWPPVDPDSPTFSEEIIPAAARYFELTGVCATPTFTPSGGTYVGTQNVFLSCATSGSTIYYTTDGSDPDNTDTEYTAEIEVASTTTIKAFAEAAGFDDSAIATAVYTIGTQAATPTFSPVAGSYDSTQNVTISSTSGGTTIYYTTDGSVPTTGSTVYSGAVAVATDTTLRAIADGGGFVTSDVGSVVYTITTPVPDAGDATATSGTAGSVTIGQ